jgi:transposase
VNLSRATMANWIIAASRDWLMPLVELMHQHLLQERYLHADELCGAPHNSSYVELYIMQSYS